MLDDADVSRLLSGVKAVDQTERGLDRLVNFSDAVVAIAITLVALPLVDIASARGASGASLLAHDGGRLAAAGLSFVIIGAFWREHHVELERAGRYSRLLTVLDLLWLAAIVFLPVPTALLFSSGQRNGDDVAADALYIGTMLVALAAMRCMQLEIARHCTAEGRTPLARWRLGAEWITVALMAAALVLSLTGLGTRALYIVLLAFPLQWAVSALHRRAERRG